MAQLLKTDSPTLAGRRTGFIQFNLNKNNKKAPLKYISNPAFQLLWFVENTWNAERVFVQCRAHFLLLWTCSFSLFHRFRCFLCISISVDPVHTPKPKHPLSLFNTGRDKVTLCSTLYSSTGTWHSTHTQTHTGTSTGFSLPLLPQSLVGRVTSPLLFLRKCPSIQTMRS